MTEALFTLTGYLPSLSVTSVDRSVYVVCSTDVFNATDDITYPRNVRTFTNNGSFSLALPADATVNAPHSTSPQFYYTVTIGTRQWIVTAQPANSTHDLTEFANAIPAIPSTTDSASVDNIVAGRVGDSTSATRGALRPLFVTEGSTRWDLTKYSVPTDGTTLADTALNTLLGNMKPGDILDIPRGASLKLAARRDLTKAITIEGNGATVVQSSNTGAFRVTSAGGGTKIRNLVGVGPSASTYNNNSVFVRLTGTLASYVEDVTLEGVTGQNWGNGTVWADFARNVRTRDILTKNSVYVGQMFLSCEDINVYNPMCDGLAGQSGNSYPVSFSRDSSQAISATPRSRRATVFGGYSRNTGWEAIDTHAGVDIFVFAHTSTNNKYGISFVGSPDTGGTNTYAPQNCWAINCTSDSGVSDGSAADGFVLAGATGLELATGGFIGCKAIGHGTESNTIGSGGARLTSTTGAAVTNFQAFECSPHGVVLSPENYNTMLSGIVATDPWSNTTAISGAVGITANTNTLTISGSQLLHKTKTATNINRGGLYANSGSMTGIKVVNGGGNDFSLGSVGPYVNCTNYMQQSFFVGNPVSRAALTTSSTLLDVINALKSLGLSS